MRKTRCNAAILCTVIMLTLMPSTALAADRITEVGTAAELRAALENARRRHVR